MLAFHTEKRFGHRRKTLQWPSDEEAGFAAPSEPIRVTVMQDEEHPISERGEELVEEEERELPPPPPAYGLWRSSVVCYHSILKVTSVANIL